jgi:hypothetical protein
MHHKRANGERVGTIPFGFHTAADGLHLEADPAEQSILSRIRELKAAGHTTRQIADELNRQGFTTRRGTRLPAYAPELNPVDYIWAYLNQHELPNVCTKNLWSLGEVARASSNGVSTKCARSGRHRIRPSSHCGRGLRPRP